MDVQLTGAPSPTGRRHRLMPNVNVTGRVLPDSVSAADLGKLLYLDKDRSSRRLSDPELYAVDVEVSDAEWAAHPRLFLRVLAPPTLVAVFNQSGVPIPPSRPSDAYTEVDLAAVRDVSTKIDRLRLHLEAVTLWSSPLVAQPGDPDPPFDIAFQFVDDTGAILAEQARLGTGTIAVADMVLVGDDGTPERLFIADVGENGPSIIDVQAAARAAGVPVTVVPLEVNHGDSWLQDQFQIGWVASARQDQHVVLHLPRAVNDSAMVAGVPNLRSFVDQHLPSDRIGVVKDLWRVPIVVAGDEGEIVLDAGSSYLLYRQLSSISDLLNTTLSLLRTAGLPAPKILAPAWAGASPDDAEKADADLASDVFAWRVGLAEAIPRLRAYSGWTTAQRAAVESLAKAMESVSEVVGFSSAPEPTVTLTISRRPPRPDEGKERTEGQPPAKDERPEQQHASFTLATREALSDFVRDLAQTHSSLHYGGNIEVSPPTSDAPYGTCVTGTLRSDRLRALITSRGRNRHVVDVHTDWLEVGHVDEILAFAGSGEDFAVLRASPALALELLDKAAAAQRGGTLVTRMFRGKKWTHQRSPASAVGSENHAAPILHVALTGEKARYDLSDHSATSPREGPKPYGGAAFQDDRAYLVHSLRATDPDGKFKAQYSASVPVADALAVLRGTNEAVETLFLTSGYGYADELRYRPYYDSPGYQRIIDKRLDHVLEGVFPGHRRQPVPVLFDKVADLLHHQTSAVTPDLVNLQTLGKHVLVPRPYGPRMRPADALALVGPVLERRAGIRELPDPSGLVNRGMTRSWHWTRRDEWVFRAGMRELPSSFDVAYPEMWRDRWAAVTASTTTFEKTGTWEIIHRLDPWRNHPEPEVETLEVIANHFRDGFDAFINDPVDFCKGDTKDHRTREEAHHDALGPIAELIERANPGVFSDGRVVAPDWVRVEIPDNTVDLFELYTQLVLEDRGLTVHWVDSWYYHTHKGGIHCGTNVLRTPGFGRG